MRDERSYFRPAGNDGNSDGCARMNECMIAEANEAAVMAAEAAAAAAAAMNE